jgi:hypothetical protein
MMRAAFAAACVLAALSPVVTRPARTHEAWLPEDRQFPGWPTAFEGRPLTALPLGDVEQRFGEAFPGRIARFTDGGRGLVVRWVHDPTRRLHPAADCYRGLGYSITPAPLRLDADGHRWGCVYARRGDERLRVCEIVRDSQGRSFTTPSSWYWSALFDRTPGPWWAVTMAEPR